MCYNLLMRARLGSQRGGGFTLFYYSLQFYHMGQKPSKWTDDQLKNAIPICDSFSEVAIYLNLSRSCNTILKKRAIELKLDFSHFRKSGYKSKSLEEVLRLKDNVPSTHRLKIRLIQLKIKEHKCEICGITRWNNLPTPIELDHINGNRFDNRLENLRVLCPNCHAQTPTYRGKNKKM
jgi:5-methylcytosine-specific restriction endonuclease McrA